MSTVDPSPVTAAKSFSIRRLYRRHKRWFWIGFGVYAVLLVLAALTGDGSGSVTVKADPFDHSVRQVEHYLKRSYLNAPSSYESVEWGPLTQNDDGTYTVSHTYRAKNGFGGVITESKVFVIDRNGKVGQAY